MKWYNKEFGKLEKIEDKVAALGEYRQRGKRKGRLKPQYNTWGMYTELKQQLSRIGYRVVNTHCCPRYVSRPGPVAATARRMMKRTGMHPW